MATKNLSTAKFVSRGYGQLEPNHLSAQRTAQIYAQLPAAASIEVLENGQFAKYDYATGSVNMTGIGEWMLVYNEVKLYKDRQQYEDFAMVKSDYVARVYSPIGQNDSGTNTVMDYTGEAKIEGTKEGFVKKIGNYAYPQAMPVNTNMVPRLLKTNVGDIFTTNCINEAPASLEIGDVLTPGVDGYLTKTGADVDGVMKWQVGKVYTMADLQPAVKLIRVA